MYTSGLTQGCQATFIYLFKAFSGIFGSNCAKKNLFLLTNCFRFVSINVYFRRDIKKISNLKFKWNSAVENIKKRKDENFPSVGHFKSKKEFKMYKLQAVHHNNIIHYDPWTEFAIRYKFFFLVVKLTLNYVLWYIRTSFFKLSGLT